MKVHLFTQAESGARCTDYEVITLMFGARLIQYEVKETSNGGRLVTVEAGYVGFVSQFLFDADGKLLSVEAYE